MQPTLLPAQTQPTLPSAQMLPPTLTQPTLPPTQTPSLQLAPSVQPTAPHQPTPSTVLLPVNPELQVTDAAPLVPEAVTQASDRYSAFEELRGIGLTSVGPETIPVDYGVTTSAGATQPLGGKYTAFDELRQLSNTHTSQDPIVPGLETPSLFSSEDTFGPFISIPPPLPSVTTIPEPPPHPAIPQPPLPVSTGAKPAGTSSTPTDVGNAGVDDLSALTGHASTSTTLSTAQATSIPVTMDDSVVSTTDLFASFGSDSQKHSTDNKSWADFSNFTTVQPVGPLANVPTISQMEAVADVPHSLTTSEPESSAAAVVTPHEYDRKPRSRSIGMEVLEEELEGDTETLQPPPPVDFSQPLVPETVTPAKGGDEDFGEFEVYGNSTAQQLPLQASEVERAPVWKPPLKVRILTRTITTENILTPEPHVHLPNLL